MKTDEMKQWLMGDGADEVAWRTDPKNSKEVGAMINALAATPGGVARSQMVARLNEERRRLDNESANKTKAQRRIDELKEFKKADAMSLGLSEREFEKVWPDMVTRLAFEGDAISELEKYQAGKRAKAAKTF